MTDNERAENASRMNSKTWRVFLVLLAALLTFVGPTYMVYVLVNILDAGFAVSIASGFASFIIGFALIVYLVKKRVIT